MQQIFDQWLGRLSTKLVLQPAGSMIRAHRLSAPGLQSHQPSCVSALAQQSVWSPLQMRRVQVDGRCCGPSKAPPRKQMVP